MSNQPSSNTKPSVGLWIGGAMILLVALIAVLVLLFNSQLPPAAPGTAVVTPLGTDTPKPVDTPTMVGTPALVPTDAPAGTPIPELGASNIFIEYILDASGSMTETLSDGSPKIDVAQQVLTEHMRSFRPETNIGLRVYGHRLPYQQTDESCQDIELIAPPEKGQMERIVGWLQDFTVQGMTPLAASLEQAQADFAYDASRVNSIVMLSDGIETCGGDPCQLVEDLKAQGINFTIHVIGLDVDDSTRQQLSCVAEAGGGTYHDARSQQELSAALGAVRLDITRDETVVPHGVNTPTPQTTAQFGALQSTETAVSQQATAQAVVRATQQAQATATAAVSLERATAVAAAQATAVAAVQATQQAQATATALAYSQEATAVAAVQMTQQAQATATALAYSQEATAVAATQATLQAQATATADAWSQIVVCGQWRIACNGDKAFQPCGANRVAYWDRLDYSPWFREGEFARVYNKRPFFKDAEPDGNIAGIVLRCEEWPVPGGWMSWSGNEQVEPINSCGECYNIP